MTSLGIIFVVCVGMSCLLPSSSGMSGMSSLRPGPPLVNDNAFDSGFSNGFGN